MVSVPAEFAPSSAAVAALALLRDVAIRYGFTAEVLPMVPNDTIASALIDHDAAATSYVVVRGDHENAAAADPLWATLVTATAEHLGVAAPRPRVRRRYDTLIGDSPPMQALYSLLDRVGPSDSTVLIQGENGTGIELVARALHDSSPRALRRFVVTNCSAFNDALLDSELFGHKRGAFTGAVADKPGLFEIADHGTFFLDEIGDMSPALQVKVLRVLQEGTFNRVGDTETRKVDVRIICATNRDLRGMIERGLFREDLYFRINVINLVLPPLRERPSDIPILIDYFLEKHQQAGGGPKKLSDKCTERLLSHSWPGNVRELENEIERLIVLSGDAELIDEDLLSSRIRHPSPSGPVASPDAATQLLAAVQLAAPGSLPAAVEALERKMIAESLARHGGNKTRAAAELKVSRRNLIRLVQQYQL